jgi:hypothetical protein
MQPFSEHGRCASFTGDGHEILEGEGGGGPELTLAQQDFRQLALQLAGQQIVVSDRAGNYVKRHAGIDLPDLAGLEEHFQAVVHAARLQVDLPFDQGGRVECQAHGGGKRATLPGKPIIYANDCVQSDSCSMVRSP